MDWGLALEEDMARETSATGNPEQQYNPWSNQSNPWSDPGCTSGSIGELEKLASGDGHHGTHSKKQGVQTDAWTADKDVNTDQDWESLMRSVDEYSTHLALQYEELMKQQQEEEADHGNLVDSLVQKKDEGIHQQQMLLDKIESLRVKLQLNCCKTTRKNFAVKKQDLSAEKIKMEEERNRLSQELKETTRKLALLIEEQNLEKLMWERELADLNTEMERLQKESEEATQTALRDEIAALEMQRDVTMSEVDDWLKEADQYINTLRFDPSQQHMQQRLEWENNVAVVHSSLAGLQNQFKEHLHLLQKGQPMESLPGVTLPHLPQVPTVDLVMSPMMYAPPLPPFQNFQMGPPNAVGMPFQPQQHHPAAFIAPARLTPPPVPSSTPPTSALPLHPATPPVSLPTTVASAQPLPFSNPPAAGKLDNLLKRLGDIFPQCNRTQLMSVLQQIKNSRGTMAGMSMDEVTQQVAQRLAQSEKPAPGPIRPLSAARGIPGLPGPIHRPPGPIQRPPGPIQRPTNPSQRPAVTQVFQTRPPQPVAPINRKLCLMCQNHVEVDSQHPMSCAHTVHKDCISVWLQSSKNNTCPFCPAK
ncbi:RING finger protein 214 [Oncorhynchus clarkii lewisi]